MSRDIGNDWVAAHQTNQGLVLSDMDRFDEAIALFEAADDSHRKLGYRHWAAVNYGGWGRALMMRDEGNDLDDAIVQIRKAEKLSRDVYYPENIALHTGDLGRIFLEKGEPHESRQYTKEAIALERRMGASKDIRHFSNLVTLARASFKLRCWDETWELLMQSIDLKKRLNLDHRHEVRKVRLDVDHLKDLETAWHQQFPAEDGDETPRVPEEIAGLKLDRNTAHLILDLCVNDLERTGYEYPWNGLETELQEKGLTTIPLFGYGSLVNRASADRTLSMSVQQGFMATVAFGIVRLLDYDMPAEVGSRSHYATPDNPIERGLFNARFTGSMCDSANGVLVEIGLDEVDALRQREVGYDLRPVICLPWGDLRGQPIYAYALGCSGRLWNGQMLSNRDLLPHRQYLDLCKAGAEEFSSDFLEYWLRTSFLADGETTVQEWWQST